jgi:adenylate kinase
MFIALTGTPGTGKTSITSIISDRLDIKLINLHQYAKEHGLICDFDQLRNSDIIDIEKIDEMIKMQYKDEPLVLLDGHIAHLLHCVSEVIVLRCDPRILLDRLKMRNWSEKKIKENIEAEILDVILCEAIQIHTPDDVSEIDTSSHTQKEIADAIILMISSNFKNKKQYSPGLIDWSEMLFSDEFDWRNF